MSKYPTPPVREMFGDVTDPVALATRHEEFNTQLDKALSTPRPAFASKGVELAKQIDDSRAFLGKTVSSNTIDSVRNALAGLDSAKDWTTSNPLSTGLVAYDLVPAIQVLAPRPTPLRNRVARTQGQGLNKQFKQILGYSGTGTGGAAGGPIRHGINETTNNQFGPGNIAYARGPKIQYASAEKFVPYIQSGLSDDVSWAAQFAGASLDDLRRVSATALLYSTMLSDERMILGGRGTKTGFAGAMAPPTGVTLAKRTAGTNEVGALTSISNLYVYVTSIDVWGSESVPSTVATVASITTGQVVDITLTDAVGSLGYRVYAGSTTGPTNTYAAAVANSSASINAAPLAAGSSVPGAPITVSFTGAGTGGVPNAGAQPPASDQTAVADEYDGILTYCTGSGAGYTKRLNNTLTGADGGNIGNVFNNAFSAMYDANKADPDELLLAGSDRKQLSDQLKQQSSSNYRIQVTGNEVHDAKIGSMTTGLQNEITGKMVDLTVHPWLPQGNVPIISWTLPIPDSSVSNCWEVSGPQDLMQVNWPVSQLLYEASTWQFNSLICYAPAWQGCIQGIFRA